MVETLTESFCERCGTRYEFKAPTRLNPLRKTRGLFGGLKNYLTSQDDLSDAIGDAMRSEEEQLASAQLEAFHESFNFCIDCRQYTCLNCWNDEAGRCRSCVPIAGTDDLADRLAASLAGTTAQAAVAEPEPAIAEDELQRRLGMDAWPTTDLAAPATNGHAPVDWPSADASGEPRFADALDPDRQPSPTEFERPLAEPQLAPEPAVAEAAPEPESEPVVAEAQPEEQPLLRVVAWEEDSGYTVEPEPVVAEVEPEPEPVVAEVEPEPEPVVAEVEPEPEPVVAEVEPEPEPVVAEVEPEPEPEPVVPPTPRIAPISETILRFPTHPAAPEPSAEPEPAAAVVESPELAARRAQLDLLGLGDPGEGPVTPERPSVLPYRSRGAAAPAATRQGTGFWEASAREVAGATGQVGVQSCGQCGLSLSANARFCRRCGTRQAQSA